MAPAAVALHERVTNSRKAFIYKDAAQTPDAQRKPFTSSLA